MNRNACYSCDMLLLECSCPDGPETFTTDDRICCPWCGMLMKDLWDNDFTATESAGTSCGHCGEDVLLFRSMSVSYKARRAERA